MGSPLPEIAEEDFRRGIEASSPRALGASSLAALFVHYRELRRWNPKLSLIGPGTADEVLARHYGEALEALPLLPDSALEPAASSPSSLQNLVDLGSGGGFPGLVLAACCPGLRVTVVEAREKKWSFLRTASRKAGISCSCINSRVHVPLDEALPDTIHLLTLRALDLPGPVFEALRARLPRSGRLLLWQTLPQTGGPKGFKRLRTIHLPRSERRCIGEYGLEEAV